jgi:hypothetical protein
MLREASVVGFTATEVRFLKCRRGKVLVEVDGKRKWVYAGDILVVTGCFDLKAGS